MVRLIFEGDFVSENDGFPLEIREFASENAAPEEMWVQDGGIELPVVRSNGLLLYVSTVQIFTYRLR